MSTDFFRKAVLTLKDLLEMGFFATTLNLSIFSIFMLSPAFIIMMPLFGISLMVLSIIQFRQFSLEYNTNFEGILKFLNGLINATLPGLISATMLLFIFLAFISAQPVVVFGWVGFILVNAPLLLLISASLTLLTQGLLWGLSVLRWYESPANSPQSSHFLQASIGYLFDAVTSASVLSTVLVLLLLPVTPYLITALALSSLVILASNIAWRFAPVTFKSGIKSAFGIEEPLIEEGVCSFVKDNNQSEPTCDIKIANRGSRLFTAPDHLSTIKSICSTEFEKKYLMKNIEQKLVALSTATAGEKTSAKQNLLLEIRDQLNSDQPKTINKNNLVIESPEVFKSFWCEKGEIESLTDAFNWFCERDHVLESGLSF